MGLIQRSTGAFAPFQALGHKLGIDGSMLIPATIFAITAAVAYYFESPTAHVTQVQPRDALVLVPLSVTSFAGYVGGSRRHNHSMLRQINTACLNETDKQVIGAVQNKIRSSEALAAVAGGLTGAMARAEQTGVLHAAAHTTSHPVASLAVAGVGLGAMIAGSAWQSATATLASRQLRSALANSDSRLQSSQSNSITLQV